MCPRLDSFFLTISDDLIKDITFPYKSCLLYTFRALHFQRAYHSSSVDKAAIKGDDEHFFMSFLFFCPFSWCSHLTTSLVSLDVLDVLVWSLASFCCSASKREVTSGRESLERGCPVFGTRTPLNLQHGFAFAAWGCQLSLQNQPEYKNLLKHVTAADQGFINLFSRCFRVKTCENLGGQVF